MRWDVAVAAWLVPVAADSDVTDLLGLDPEFSKAGERDFKVPSLEYSLIVKATKFQEVYWRTLIQLDYWTKTLAELISLEKALIRLLDFDVPTTFGAVPMWSEMVPGEGGPLEGTRDGVNSGSLDFHLIYLRARYST